MYKHIEPIRPYFFSLREIKNLVSLDIRIPLDWVYNEFINEYENINIKIQDSTNKQQLISITSLSDKKGYDSVFDITNRIILFNKEREEKNKLLENKIAELQMLFNTQSYDKLKNINFDKILNKDANEEQSSLNQEDVGVVRQGDKKGSKRD